MQQSDEKYFYWTSKAAKQNYPPALYHLGLCEIRGIGTGIDIRHGLIALKISAGKGCIGAEFELAMLHFTGSAQFSQDKTKAKEYFQAVVQRKSSHYQEKALFFWQMCNLSYAEGKAFGEQKEHYAGLWYLFIEKNEPLAIEHLKNACTSAGHSDEKFAAMFELVNIYEKLAKTDEKMHAFVVLHLSLLKKSPLYRNWATKKLLSYVRETDDDGFVISLKVDYGPLNPTILMESSVKVEEQGDTAMALKYAREAAQQAYSHAELAVYRLLSAQNNFAEANSFLIRAVNHGCSMAKAILAQHYFLGSQGFEKDKNLALKYLHEAITCANPPALACLLFLQHLTESARAYNDTLTEYDKADDPTDKQKDIQRDAALWYMLGIQIVEEKKSSKENQELMFEFSKAFFQCCKMTYSYLWHQFYVDNIELFSRLAKNDCPSLKIALCLIQIYQLSDDNDDNDDNDDDEIAEIIAKLEEIVATEKLENESVRDILDMANNLSDELAQNPEDAYSSIACELYRVVAPQSLTGHLKFADCLLTGYGVKQDLAQAIAILEDLAEQKQYPPAQAMLGKHLLESNLARAIALLGKAATMGDKDAINELVLFYNKQETKSEHETVQLQIWEKINNLIKLAKQTDKKGTQAQYELGLMFLSGKEPLQKNPSKAFPLLQKAADGKTTQVMFPIGLCYINGEGVKPNLETGLAWCANAAEKGDPDAILFLINHFRKTKNQGKTFKWLLQAANLEHAPSQFEVSQCYLHGIGVPPNKEEAVTWLEKAATNMHSDARALYELGLLHLTDGSVRRNIPLATSFFEKADDLGNADATTMLGRLCLNESEQGSDPTKAVQLFKKAVSQKNSVAMFHLGNCYRSGLGTEEDMPECVRWWEEAAELGNADAQNNLAHLCELGWGVKRDEKKAEELYLIAAHSGYAEANNALGMMHLEGGEVVKKDVEKAIPYLKFAAEKGNTNSQFLLGLLCEKGEKVAKDLKEAKRLIELAAKGGHSDAVIHLALHYSNDMDDIEKSEWLAKAASLEDPRAQCLYAGRYLFNSGDRESKAKAFKNKLFLMLIRAPQVQLHL